MCQIKAATYRAGVAHSTVHRARMLGLMVTVAMLSACSVAPGMRMIQPPTLPVSNTDDGKATGEEQIPITDITLASVQQMHQMAAQPGASGAAALYGEP